MIQVKFKNLEKSELAKEAAVCRLEPFIEKFKSLEDSRIQVTLEMENSPFQPGPDRFNVKVHIFRGRFNGVTVEKSDTNLYVALAKVTDHLLEILNRFGDRARVRTRKTARDLTKETVRRME